MTNASGHTNKLIHESSPYLRQHAHNPVDWYAWGPEALERAKREDRPIFLSIGYSACHWCHVMERESFEDAATAAILNEHFISIKVDREERPDLDQIYMTAVQLLTRHGGWPMSVFLTPDLQPFHGGTYFPPDDRMGMPSFQRVLHAVASAWRDRRPEVLRGASELTDHVRRIAAPAPKSDALELDFIDHAVILYGRIFDPVHGGFGSAPKFPHPMDLKVCLRHWRRTGDAQSLAMVTTTLDRMSRGGIYDHLGGGFARYSTDARWLVPHFEKMLYDNALLTSLLLEAYQATGDAAWATAARGTLDWLLAEMTDPDGGWYGTLDADSEGEEGRFYVWTLAEIQQVLGEADAQLFAAVYGVTKGGNWEGHNILSRVLSVSESAARLGLPPDASEARLRGWRDRLHKARANRVPPGRDDKILVSWNGLALDAMARGHQVLGDVRYLTAAQHAAAFLLRTCRATSSGSLRLLHSCKDGKARFTAYLDDYANLIDGLVSLYESDFDGRWLGEAAALAEVMLDEFWDDQSGNLFYTGRSHEALVARTKDVSDNATPSGNAMAATALIRLGRLLGRDDFVMRAQRILESCAQSIVDNAMASGQLLVALDLLLASPCELALVPGSSEAENTAALAALRRVFLPAKVVAMPPTSEADADPGTVPWLAGKAAQDGRATLYWCENYTCGEPRVGTEAIEKALRDAARPAPATAQRGGSR